MKLRRILSFFLMIALSCSIVLAIGHQSQAQFSLPDGNNSSSKKPPVNVTRYGNIETIDVMSPVDGRELFLIASPTVSDRSNQEGENLPVEDRADQIRGRLQFAILRPMNLKTLIVGVSQLNNVTIISARDDKYTRPLVLLSVTDLDADINGIPIDELAQKWREIVEKDLRRGLEKWEQDPITLLKIIMGLLVLTVIIVALKYGLSKRQKALWKRKQELRESSSVESPHDPVSNASLESEEEQLSQKRSQFLQKLQHVITLDRQLGLLDLFQWLLFWLLIVGWYTGLFQLLSRIPILAQYRYSFLGIPVKLLLIWFFTGLAIRLSRGLIDKVRTSWENNNFTRFIHLGDAQRSKLRTETITSAVKGLATVIIATTGLLAVLSILRIPTGSVLAIGGLLGLAISFGSQNLMNDLVNGFLILAEDQYAIGDVVDLGTAAGLVENLNLRVTQLRSGGGELVTIPNSIIRDVKNLTRSWSRVNFTIDVAYDTDPEKALSVLKQTAQGLYDDPEWHGKIVAPPDVLGIDNVSHSGLSLTTWIKTAPGEHWSVGREFRFRVRKALEANGIEIGVPQQTHIMETPHSETSSKT